MYKLFFTTSLIALVAGSGVSVAQDAPAKQETVLSTIVVTPLRRESALASATASVTVIDRASIEKAPTLDLLQLLRSYAGVSVVNYGGMGASSSLSLRGMGSTRTLVLVNGVRVSSATSGTATLSNIPLESIERVEIAKGPHSSAYGADAIGGVINIITREGGSCGNGKVMCGSVTAGVSYPWGAFTNADVRGEKDGTTFAIGGSLIGTRGYDFTYPTTWGHEPDDDGFLRGSFNFNLAKRFDWGKLYADGQFSRGRSQYDSLGSNETDATTFNGKLGARLDHSEDWFTTLEVSHGFDRSKSFRDNVAGSEVYQTRRTGVLAQTEKSFETGALDHTLLFGGEFYRENVVVRPTNYGTTERDVASAFAQYSLGYEDLHFDSGLRYDYNEQFGDALTYNVGAAYDLTDDLTLRTSWGTGFRAPSFNDLYYPLDGWGMHGNPNLRPEHSKSLEAGLTWEVLDGTKLDVSVYRNWLKDGIVWGWVQPDNISRMQVTGLEVSVNHTVNDRLSLNGAIDWRDPRDESTNKYIANIERFKANAGFTFAATEALSIDVSAIYGSGAFTNAANTARLDSYVTVDTSAIYKFDEQSSVKLAAENLFDNDYATRDGYRAPGRTVTFSFTRKF